MNQIVTTLAIVCFIVIGVLGFLILRKPKPRRPNQNKSTSDIPTLSESAKNDPAFEKWFKSWDTPEVYDQLRKIIESKPAEVDDTPEYPERDKPEYMIEKIEYQDGSIKYNPCRKILYTYRGKGPRWWSLLKSIDKEKTGEHDKTVYKFAPMCETLEDAQAEINKDLAKTVKNVTRL